MKTYALFQEYIWLVDTIHRAGRLTLSEINERWLRTEMSEGVSIARSTFNRHRDAILDMFGIVIECDKKDGFRYYIYNEEVLEEDSIQNWMLSTEDFYTPLLARGAAIKVLEPQALADAIKARHQAAADLYN